jgi:hypothetical protein
MVRVQRRKEVASLPSTTKNEVAWLAAPQILRIFRISTHLLEEYIG